MAAKKIPARMVTAKKKVTPSGSSSLEQDIMKRYGITGKSMVSSRGSAEPGKTGPVSRKEYVSQFVDVVAESPLASKRGWQKAATNVATREWNNTFGPKKAAKKGK